MPARAPVFYLEHGTWSDPGAFTSAFDAVPGTVAAITGAVQNLLIHDYFGAHLYADPPKGIDSASRATLPIAERLARSAGPFGSHQPASQRLVGTCRDFALMTCAALRHHGIAARVRCGFARYFHPPTYEDHWICEYWERGTWHQADAQLDAAHRSHLGIPFDPNAMPDGQFIYPWQVWEHHRERLSDFGHGEANGLWFLRVNLARDFLALTKHEVSDWDSWRDQTTGDKQETEEAVAQ